MTFTIKNTDCLSYLKTLLDNSVHAIITDPPAGIGFMGKDWDKDKGGRDVWVKWMTEIAAECLRVLKHGGHAIVWSLPRTSHWTAMAWEDGGFEVRDKIKSLRSQSTILDDFINSLTEAQLKAFNMLNDESAIAHIFGSGFPKGANIGKYGGGEAWQGWGTALKPAHEDWLVLRKPIEKGLSIAQNCLKHGTGAINIDLSRVSTDSVVFNTSDTLDAIQGRYPANIIIENEQEVTAAFPYTKSGAIKPHVMQHKKQTTRADFISGLQGKVRDYKCSANEGSAARHFQCFVYKAKASPNDRNSFCEGLQEKRRTTQVIQTIGRKSHGEIENGKQLSSPAKNHHPTVKPIELMNYFINLISKEGDVVLDPFMGSGTTGVACLGLNRFFIGVEKDPEYFEIAQTRLQNIANQKSQMLLL